MPNPRKLSELCAQALQLCAAELKALPGRLRNFRIPPPREMLRMCAASFTRSAALLGNVRALAMAAVLLALNVALNGVSIYITPEIKIGVSFLTQAAVGMLLGPVYAMLTGAAGDILQAMLFPKGAFFPGYTLTAVLSGLIYGVLLFERRPPHVFNVVLSKAFVNLFCNIGLNTLWLYLTTHNGFWALLPARALKNITLLPLEALLMYIALRAVAEAARRTHMPGRR